MPGPAGGYDADVLIAGGGPAGLAMAIQARLHGLSCIVIEPRAGIQDKACGEGLLPAACELMAAMGIDPSPTVPLNGIRYVAGAACAEGRFRCGRGLGMRRVALHAAMLERATALGARVARGLVRSFQDDGAGVSVEGYRARWLVGCDGLRSGIKRAMGVGEEMPLPRRLGVRRHFYAVDWPPFVEVHWHPGFELYVTPVAPGLVNVAALFRAGLSFEECLARAPELTRRLGAGVTPPQGAGPFGRWARSPRVGNVFLVGDAAGFIDPVTGEGNHLAMRAAAALALCLARGRPEDFAPAWRRMTWGYRRLTLALLLIARRPWLAARLVPTLQAWPELFQAGFALLDGCAAAPER